MKVLKSLDFYVGFSDDIDKAPAEMVKATVPGAVQLDWADAHAYLPYYHGANPPGCRKADPIRRRPC